MLNVWRLVVTHALQTHSAHVVCLQVGVSSDSHTKDDSLMDLQKLCIEAWHANMGYRTLWVSVCSK